ncbi:MAG: NAD kinase, partial [Xanthomonadales bacterium]|nr:NAD kinase [Xanthomonadales bacterium]
MARERVHFMASASASAQAALAEVTGRYGQAPLTEADVVVAIGGDGYMLHTLHAMTESALPVYGMKTGNVGFLMNRFVAEGLLERLDAAELVALHPLRMSVSTQAGEQVEGLAINEVSLLRQTNQAAHIRISVNGSVKVEELVCDGVLLATTAGSTAYNFSVRGPILPLGTDALALTPISPFRPRRWRGAVLPASARVRFEVLDPDKRAVSATADAFEVRNIVAVDIYESRALSLRLLFDPEHSLEERI